MAQLPFLVLYTPRAFPEASTQVLAMVGICRVWGREGGEGQGGSHRPFLLPLTVRQPKLLGGEEKTRGRREARYLLGASWVPAQ